MKYLIFLLCILLFSCQDTKRTQYAKLIKEWEGREILFPASSVFTIQGQDPVDISNDLSGYKILTYVDSIGCVSCKLRLQEWNLWIEELDSIVTVPLSFLFYFHPKKIKDLKYIIRRDGFFHPVCIDFEDELNKLNQFPSDDQFHTFLLDSSNRVTAIGNPITNPLLKDLYLKVLTNGKEYQSSTSIQTKVKVPKSKYDFGSFPMDHQQVCTFNITNVGDYPLVIHNVSTSCGCTSVDYTREPVLPKRNAILTVKYTADQSGKFDKSIMVYCNTSDSPLRLRVKGESVINKKEGGDTRLK